MAKDIDGSVVVITGAASGIGRATALDLAGRGAKLVLAGRREQALQDLAAECEQRGGAAISFAVDVTDEGRMLELARTAASTYGRIDVWVNNAAVYIFGRFEDVPSAAFRRVIETNVFGCVHGSRAALPYFKQQGSGVLINLSSIAAEIAHPFTSPYVASKWAVRGFSESLRMELKLDGSHDIHVCTVLPATIDTPIFQHAANYTGRRPKAMRPVYDAQQVALVISGLITKPRREVFVGNISPLVTWQHRLAPSLLEGAMARMADRDLFEDRPAERNDGNLFEPMHGYETVGGNWKSPDASGGRSLGSAVPLAGLAALGGWLAARSFTRRGQKRRSLLRRLKDRL